MNEKQAFNQITSQKDWWQGYCSRSYATQLVQRYEAGLLKQKTINKLLTDFGYTVVVPAQWVKLDN